MEENDEEWESGLVVEGVVGSEVDGEESVG